jgi:hypothetical protein
VPAVKAGERSGWRDQEISRRHRRWGFTITATDLDFLLVEYVLGLPVAIVEYKHCAAGPVDLDHPTYLALRNLADRPPALPFVIARYWPDTWAFRVTAVNDVAAGHFGASPCDLSEHDWVLALHDLRAMTAHAAVLRNLNQLMPPVAA